MKRRAAFTLVELLIVMGIIILFLTMAIPTVRALSGSNSISMAINMMSAVLTRAREEAIAAQDIRGVLLYLDPNTNRVIAVIVQPSTVQDSTWGNYVILDEVPSNDSLILPYGVGVQSIFNGYDPSTPGSNTSALAAQANAATGKSDRYMGFNSVGSSPATKSVSPPLVGGVFLFDGNGKLMSTPYGYQMAAASTSTSYTPASNLAILLQIGLAPTASATAPTQTFASDSGVVKTNMLTYYSYVAVPGIQSLTANGPCNFPVTSQLGMVFYDADTFASLGFTNQDAIFQSSGSYTTAWPITNGGNGINSELDEETWLDNNTTPVMINRQNGSLIRGE